MEQNENILQSFLDTMYNILVFLDIMTNELQQYQMF